MKWFPLFIVANLLDAGITQYLLTSDYPVEEVNPIILKMMDYFGWAGFWIYKIVVPCLLTLVVYSIFCKKKQDGIMKWASFIMLCVVGYMVGLGVYLNYLS